MSVELAQNLKCLCYMTDKDCFIFFTFAKQVDKEILMCGVAYTPFLTFN